MKKYLLLLLILVGACNASSSSANIRKLEILSLEEVVKVGRDLSKRYSWGVSNISLPIEQSVDGSTIVNSFSIAINRKDQSSGYLYIALYPELEDIPAIAEEYLSKLESTYAGANIRNSKQIADIARTFLVSASEGVEKSTILFFVKCHAIGIISYEGVKKASSTGDHAMRLIERLEPLVCFGE